jgi:hypothetical protein
MGRSSGELFGPRPMGRRLHARALVGIITAVALGISGAACATGGAGTATSVPPTGASRTPGSPSPLAASPFVTPAATTSTDWGWILDAPPVGLPRFPSATDATPEGPATATLSTGSSVAQVITWYDAEMVSSGYVSGGAGRPLEDGSVVVEYDGAGIAAGCHAQVTARPRGGETVIVILVGAACHRA